MENRSMPKQGAAGQLHGLFEKNPPKPARFGLCEDGHGFGWFFCPVTLGKLAKSQGTAKQKSAPKEVPSLRED